MQDAVTTQDRSRRGARQVWDDHLAAIRSGDPERILSDYAEDAALVMAGTVITGKESILRGFAAFAARIGGQIPTVTSVTACGEVVLVEYRLETPDLLIPDGVDTFVVRDGLIRYQTVHASFQQRSSQ